MFLTFLNSCDKRFNKFCMHEIQHHAPSSDLCKPTSIKLIIIVINASHGENVQFPTEHSAIFDTQKYIYCSLDVLRNA